jgi:anthranilate synthase/aminodeoxychorismate synthase-like glutamine amidotransferase
VVVRRNDAISVDEIGELAPSAIVLSPGPCTPKEAGITVETIRRWGSSIPILGVCLGHQAIGEAYGGEVVRAERVMHGKTSATMELVSSPDCPRRWRSCGITP